MKRIVLLLGILLIVSVLFACAPKVVPASPVKEKPAEAAVPVAKGGWEDEWVKTLQGAKKEGKVVVYAASTGPAIKQAIPLFKQKYGLDLEVVTGKGAEIARKFLTERANGLFLVDVFNSGMNNVVGEAKPAGALDPLEPALILPEVTDSKAWIGEELPWGDKDRLVFKFFSYPSSPIGINIEQARPEGIKSYYDLLAPKWKGEKITINDPTISGIGFNTFSSLILNKALELDFFRQLVQQQPVVIRDQRLQIDWLARGKYPVALWPQPGPFSEYKEVGAPIAFTPPLKEGSQLAVGGGALSLVNRAPHPNAAKVFINWLLSKEGQIYMQNDQQLQSARVDISTKDVDPLKIRRPGEKYFMSANTIEEWIVKEQDRYYEMARQVFGPLIR